MLIDVIVSFFYFFAIPLKYLPANTGKLVFILLFIFYFVNEFIFVNRFKQTGIKINIDILFVVCMFCIAIWVSLFTAFVKLTYDFSLAYTYLVNLIENFMGTLLLCYYLRARNYSFDNMIFLILSLVFIQSFIIVFSFFLEPMREFFFSINKFEETFRDLYSRYGGFRGLGFSGAVTFDLAVFLSISFIIIQLYKPSCINLLKRFFLYFLLLLSFLAICITGRTGFIGLIISIIVLLILSVIQKKYRRIFQLIVGVSIAFLFSLYTFNIFKMDYPHLENAYEYAFELIESKSSGQIKTNSTDRLLEMLNVEVKGSTYISGDGYWINPHNPDQYYMRVDAGYKRHLLFYGLPATIIVFSSFITVCLYFIIKSYIVKPDLALTIVLISLLFFFLLVQIKGDFIFGSSMNMKLLFLLMMYPQFLNRKA